MTGIARIKGRRIDTRWVSTAARLMVGGVYAVSGYTKVVDIDETIRSVRAYRLLPEAVVPSIGSALPVLELALGALLIGGLLTRAAAVLAFALSLVFFTAVASAWVRGLNIECGCFGNGGLSTNPVPGYVRELVLNTVLMAAAAWLIRRPGTFWPLETALRLSPTAESDSRAEMTNHDPRLHQEP